MSRRALGGEVFFKVSQHTTSSYLSTASVRVMTSFPLPSNAQRVGFTRRQSQVSSHVANALRCAVSHGGGGDENDCRFCCVVVVVVVAVSSLPLEGALESGAAWRRGKGASTLNVGRPARAAVRIVSARQEVDVLSPTEEEKSME